MDKWDLTVEKIPHNKEAVDELAEVVGSTPTVSIFIYEVTAALNPACSGKLSDKTPAFYVIEEER
ncbi:MAG TPA: hypothetical protein VE692_01720 [Nitrososphaera sp.]|nr:hypothetical protein [Nitrososphaera sp.]